MSQTTVTTAQYTKTMNMLAKHLKVGTGKDAFAAGTGLTLVLDWDGPGQHAIVGEGPAIPDAWSVEVSCDDKIVTALTKEGIYAEAYDGCTLRLYPA